MIQSKKAKEQKMKIRRFKLYIDGETVKDKFGEDIIAYDEPKKITSGRLDILLFTAEQKEKLFKDLDIKLTGKETNKELYETIFEKAEQKYKEKIDFPNDLYDVIGYGEFKYIGEDNRQFVDDLGKYPFSIWNEEVEGCGAGKTSIWSEEYGVQIGNWPNWTGIYCDNYEEITE